MPDKYDSMNFGVPNTAYTYDCMNFEVHFFHITESYNS